MEDGGRDGGDCRQMKVEQRVVEEVEKECGEGEKDGDGVV